MLSRFKQSLGLEQLPVVPVPDSVTACVSPLAALGVPPAVSCMAWCPLTRLVALGTQLGIVKVLGAAGACPLECALDVALPVTHVAFQTGRHRLLVAAGSTLFVCSLGVGLALVARVDCPDRVTALCAPPGRAYAYVGTDKARVLVLTDTLLSQYAVSPEQVGLTRLARDSVVVVAQHPTDEFALLLGYSGGTLVEWNLRDAQPVRRFEGGPPRGGLLCAAWKRDGKALCAGYSNGALFLWNRKENAKPHKTFFGNGDHRPVRSVLWSERAGANVIVCVGGTPNAAPDGFTVLTGSPVSAGKIIAAASPAAACFLDTSAQLSDVDAPTLLVATSDARLFAYDTQVPLQERNLLPDTVLRSTDDPVWCHALYPLRTPHEALRWRALASPSAPGCLSALGGSLTAPPDDLTRGSAIVANVHESGCVRLWLQLAHGPRLELLGTVDACLGGRAATPQSLPQPCERLLVRPDAPQPEFVLWSTTELVVLRWSPEQRPYAGVAQGKPYRVQWGSAEAATMDPAAPPDEPAAAAAAQGDVTALKTSTEAPVQPPVVVVAAASPVEATSRPSTPARPATPSATAVLEAPTTPVSPATPSPAAVVEAPTPARPVTPSAAAVAETPPPPPPPHATTPARPATPVVDAVPRPSTPAGAKPASAPHWCTVLTLSDCGAIRWASWFEELLFVVCDTWVGVWRDNEEWGRFTVAEDVIALHATRDPPLCLNGPDDPAAESTVIKAWLLCASGAWYCLELHERAARSQRLCSGKPLVGAPLVLLKGLERAPFVVVVDQGRVVVRRAPRMDEVCSWSAPEGWRCAAACVVDGEWALALVLERQDGTTARVVLLPLVNVALPALHDAVVFDSNAPAGLLASRWRFAGGLGSSVLYALDATGWLSAVSSYGSEVFTWSLSAASRAPAVVLATPELKLPERSKGWLSGLLAADPDDIASLFSATNAPMDRAPASSPSGSSTTAAAKGRSSTLPARSAVGQTQAVMEENRRMLVERGEKLDEMGDRAAELNETSSDFLANVAKLRKQQEKKLFGIF